MDQNTTVDAPEPRRPSTGDVVRVRTRTYLVEAVETDNGYSPIVRLACLDDDAQGETLEVVWDLEVGSEILDAESWKLIGQKGFDQARLFAAYIHTLRWNCVTATDPKLFQAPFRAGIRIDAYQLEPLRKALLLPRVNLFIADDVGLGKTIEAGLIASELLLRRRVREIVVACPPTMLLQWKDELESRFGLTFEVLDRQYIERVRQERGYGVNPWTTFPRLLIDEAYAGPLRDWLDNLRPGSLLIFTEYDDTKRYLVELLRAAIANTDLAEHRIEVFHGPTPPDKREAIKRAFNLSPSENPVRILVATDAAREGLNLQAHCWNVFHFDLPWNPSRLEQRNGREQTIPEPVERRLRAAMAPDIEELLPHLGQRGQNAKADAEKRLAERGHAESQSMLRILEEQKKRVAEQAGRAAQLQLDLFNDQEKRQFESNRRYWQRWLENVEGDIQREPARIMDFYTVASFRIEPIGLAYLWPVTG